VIELSRRYRLPVLGIVLSPPRLAVGLPPEAGAAAVRCAPRAVDEFGRPAGEVAAYARDTITHCRGPASRRPSHNPRLGRRT
jgi:hypothetical protein